jgi:DNA polymerase I-like protein with 3'-5' exonuclease and polymerase domains
MNKWLARLRALDADTDPGANIFEISETMADQTTHRVFGDNEDFGTRSVAEISPGDALGHTPGVPQEATRRAPDCPTLPGAEISEIVGTAVPWSGKGAALDDVFSDARVFTCGRCGSTTFGAVDGGEVCVTCSARAVGWGRDSLVTAAALEAALTRVTSAREIVLDVETDGLEPFLAGHRLIGLAIEADGIPFYFAFRHRAGIEANLPEAALARVLEAALQPGRPVLGHNVRFDALLMALEGERWYHLLLNPDGVPLEDTGLHAQLHNECEPNASLDALGQRYLGDAAMKRARKAELLAALRALYPTRSVAMMRRLHPGETLSTAELRALHPQVKDKDLMGHLAELPPAQVALYAAGDVADTRALRDHYLPLLASAGHERLARELADFSRLLTRIQHRGIRLDRQLCRERITALRAESAAQLAALRAATTPTFNPHSTKDVQAVFGLTGSTSKEVLANLSDARAQQVIDARRTRTEVYDGLLRYLGADDILHPHFHLAAGVDGEGGTRTGRLSSSDPNLQNLPKRDITNPLLAARQAIIARPGFVLLKFDYEKAEPWMAAHYSHSKALYDVYHGGLDLYVELAKRVGGDYQAAKSAWLSIPYGTGIRSLMRRYGWSWEKAQQVRAGFFAEYPEIECEMRKAKAEVMQTGGITLWTGRRLHFNADMKRAIAQRKQLSVESDVSYMAWNSLIQGGVGEMVRVAMQRLERPLAAVGAFMILQCHDEIVIECPVGAVDAVVALTCEQMTAFDFWLRPRVECERGENYWDMTKIRAAIPSPRLSDSV